MLLNISRFDELCKRFFEKFPFFSCSDSPPFPLFFQKWRATVDSPVKISDYRSQLFHEKSNLSPPPGATEEEAEKDGSPPVAFKAIVRFLQNLKKLLFENQKFLYSNSDRKHGAFPAGYQ